MNILEKLTNSYLILLFIISSAIIFLFDIKELNSKNLKRDKQIALVFGYVLLLFGLCSLVLKLLS